MVQNAPCFLSPPNAIFAYGNITILYLVQFVLPQTFMSYANLNHKVNGEDLGVIFLSVHVDGKRITHLLYFLHAKRAGKMILDPESLGST